MEPVSVVVIEHGVVWVLTVRGDGVEEWTMMGASHD